MKIFTVILMSMLIAAPALASDPKVQELKALYNELLAFKDDEAFKRYGFAESCELLETTRELAGKSTEDCPNEDFNPAYAQWLGEIKTLDEHTFSGSPEQKFYAGVTVKQLRLLAMEYVQTNGQETDYTRYAREELDRYLSELNDE